MFIRGYLKKWIWISQILSTGNDNIKHHLRILFKFHCIHKKQYVYSSWITADVIYCVLRYCQNSFQRQNNSCNFVQTNDILAVWNIMHRCGKSVNLISKCCIMNVYEALSIIHKLWALRYIDLHFILLPSGIAYSVPCIIFSCIEVHFTLFFR